MFLSLKVPPRPYAVLFVALFLIADMRARKKNHLRTGACQKLQGNSNTKPECRNKPAKFMEGPDFQHGEMISFHPTADTLKGWHYFSFFAFVYCINF